MALTAQDSNLISELMNLAEAQIALLDKAHNLLARWNQNGVFERLTDEDVESIFPHLTKSEVANAINAITAVSTALGNEIDGQVINLIKLKG